MVVLVLPVLPVVPVVRHSPLTSGWVSAVMVELEMAHKVAALDRWALAPG